MSSKNLHYWTSWPPGWVNLIILFLFINKVTPTYIFGNSSKSFARFPKWDYQNFSLNFEFLTNQPKGLLLYTDDGKSNFLELKLLDGVLFIRTNFGAGIASMKSTQALNDTKYHKVMIMVSDKNIFMEIDGIIMKRALQQKKSIINVIDNVFFGGLPHTYFSQLDLLSLPSVMFEDKFQGQIKRIFFIDKHQKILISPADLETSEITIEREKSVYSCHLNNSCLNGQKCLYVHKIEECDCWNFGYQGAKCEREKIAAQFGPSVRMITIADLTMDLTDIHITFSFMTNSSDCVLIYLENSANKKYLQLKLSDGKLRGGYWIGKFLRVLKVKGNFADLRYHTVNFTQKGQNITLKIDNLIADSSKDEELTELILSGSNLIEIGGSRNPETNEIDESFNGIFSDLILNNIPLLDLITNEDPRVSIDGNVTVQNFPLLKTTSTSSLTSNGSHQSMKHDMDQEEDGFSGSGSGSGSGCASGNCDEDDVFSQISDPELHSPPENKSHNDLQRSGCKDDNDDNCNDFIIEESFTVFQDFNSTENQTTDPNDVEATENPISKQSRKNTSSLNIYLILGLVAEGVILLIILTFAIYKFSQCRTQKREKQQYNLVQNSNYPEQNDNKAVAGDYTIKENNYYD